MQEFKSPLWCASQNGLTDVVNLLLKCGSNIESKDTVMTKIMLSTVYQACFVQPTSILRCIQDGRSPLYVASAHNETEVMKILITKGANVNVQEEVTK